MILSALMVAISCYADERGVEVLQRISRRYTSLGSYRLHFTLALSDGSASEGELAVSGNNLYMKMANNEIFVEDSVRYEVHPRQREVVIDRTDAYDKEGFNPLKGVEGLENNYDARYDESMRLLHLTPKSGTSDTIVLGVSVDGESVERVTIGGGATAVVIGIGSVKYTQQMPPKFDRTKYNGFEIIDFR